MILPIAPLGPSASTSTRQSGRPLRGSGSEWTSGEDDTLKEPVRRAAWVLPSGHVRRHLTATPSPGIDAAAEPTSGDDCCCSTGGGGAGWGSGGCSVCQRTRTAIDRGWLTWPATSTCWSRSTCRGCARSAYPDPRRAPVPPRPGAQQPTRARTSPWRNPPRGHTGVQLERGSLAARIRPRHDPRRTDP